MVKIRREELSPEEAYEKQKGLMKKWINRDKKDLTEKMGKLEDAERKYGKKSAEYQDLFNDVQRTKFNLDSTTAALKFVRPNKPTDVKYRRTQLETFCSELRAVMSKKLDLRFHGTPIYFAEQIIKSGKISSSADRYDGYIRSTDPKGEISVANIDSIEQAVVRSDLSGYQSSLPCGCVFALFPAGMEDEEFSDLMQNIDLKEKPDQLFGIFTTPENIDMVQGWMKEADLDPEKVFTFEQFKKYVQEQSVLLDNGEPGVVPTFPEESGGKRGKVSLDYIKKITQMQEKSKKGLQTIVDKIKKVTDKKDETDLTQESENKGQNKDEEGEER